MKFPVLFRDQKDTGSSFTRDAERYLVSFFSGSLRKKFCLVGYCSFRKNCLLIVRKVHKFLHRDFFLTYLKNIHDFSFCVYRSKGSSRKKLGPKSDPSPKSATLKRILGKNWRF